MSKENLRVEVVGELAALKLEPGDAIVVTFPDRLHPEQVDRLRETLAAGFPNNRVVVVDSGARLGVLRPATERSGPSELRTAERSTLIRKVVRAALEPQVDFILYSNRADALAGTIAERLTAELED